MESGRIAIPSIAPGGMEGSGLGILGIVMSLLLLMSSVERSKR